MFNKIWFKFSERVSLKTLVLRTPCFGSSYPQVVRVPPVKNHWSKRKMLAKTSDVDVRWGRRSLPSKRKMLAKTSDVDVRRGTKLT